MDHAPIEIDNDVFSCIQKGKFALITLRENALNIATSVGLKEELFSALSAVEESKSIRELILINSTQYPGDAKYLELLERLIGSESFIHSKHKVKKLENMHSQIMSILHKFEKPIVAAMHGNI